MAAIDVIRDPFSGPQEIEGGVGGVDKEDDTNLIAQGMVSRAPLFDNSWEKGACQTPRDIYVDPNRKQPGDF